MTAAACRVIHTFMPKILDNFRFSSGSNVGRGGMEAKVASAWDAAQSGVTTVIANGKLPSVLLRVRCSKKSPKSRAISTRSGKQRRQRQYRYASSLLTVFRVCR